jgi:hypothetical protein
MRPASGVGPCRLLHRPLWRCGRFAAKQSPDL